MRQLGHLKIDKICKFVFSNRKWEERKIFELEKGKHSNQKKKNIPIRKRNIFQVEKGYHYNQKIFQLEKGNESNQKKENIPIRKRKIFQ